MPCELLANAITIVPLSTKRVFRHLQVTFCLRGWLLKHRPKGYESLCKPWEAMIYVAMIYVTVIRLMLARVDT